MTRRRIARSRSDPLVSLALTAALTLVLAAVGGAASAQDVRTPGATPPVTAPPAAASDTSAQPVQAEPASAPATGFFREPRFIRRAISLSTRTVNNGAGAQSGWYAELSNMPTGAGWISAGPGFRQYLFRDRLVVDASTAVSWRTYKMAQGRIELPKLAHSRVAVGSQFVWRDLTQITYFGEGPDTTDETRSEYRMRDADVSGYATIKPLQWLTVGTNVGWLHRPELLSPAGWFKRGNAATATVFADDPVYALSAQPNYLHGEASLTADTRDSRSHPTGGGVYRAAFATYSDRNADAFSFRRFEAEAAQFVPLADRKIVLAAHAWLVGTDTDAGQRVPFYLLPSLGGSNTLRGYTDFRFHDRALLVVNAESRFAVFSHVDLAAFMDAGNVSAGVADLNLAKHDYGVGVRVHTGDATFGRFDVAHGSDGWRFLLRTNDPLHLSRLTRRSLAAPFVP